MWKFLLFFVSLLSFNSLSAQSFEGTEFWVTWLPNASTSSSGNSNQIHIISKIDTKVYIEIPKGGVPLYDTLAVSAFQVVSYDFLYFQRTFSVNSEVIEQKGVRITSDAPVLIYLGNYEDMTTDVALAIPFNACGNEYDVVTISDPSISGGGTYNRSQFVIIGNEDNTQLTVTIKGKTKGGLSTGNVINFNLNQAETYTVIADNSSGPTNTDLTGTKIISTNGKRFSVYAGNNCATIGDCGDCDHLFEQIRPTNTLGKTFHVAITEKSYPLEDLVRVYAVRDYTNYSFDGVVQPVLNKTQYKDFDLTAGVEIISDKPIQVTQFLKGHYCAPVPLETDPLMMDILPAGLHSATYTFGTSSFNRFNIHYISVISETSEIPNLQLDGASLNITNWQPITGSTRSYGSKVVDIATSYTLTNTNGVPFSLFVYGYGERESYGYSAGGQLINLDTCPEAGFDFTPSGVSREILVTDTSYFGSFNIVEWEWAFGDGDTTTIGLPGPGNTSHIYPRDGYYSVALKILNDAKPEPCADSIKTTIQVGNIDPCIYAGYYLDGNGNDFGSKQLHAQQNNGEFVAGPNGMDNSALHLNNIQGMQFQPFNDFKDKLNTHGFNFYYKADSILYPDNSTQSILTLSNSSQDIVVIVAAQRINGLEGIMYQLTDRVGQVLEAFAAFDGLLDGRWHCVSVVVKNAAASELEFAVDGVIIPHSIVINQQPSLFTDGTYTLSLGKTSATGNMETMVGSIDELVIYECDQPNYACTFGTPNQFFIYPEFSFISCGSQSTVSGITIGGVPPITYQIPGYGSSTSLLFDSVAPGTHKILAEDATGAKRRTEITVGPTDIVIDKVDVFGAGCNGEKGGISINHCGYAPYTYLLNGQNTSGPFFGNLDPGTYTISITDSQNNTKDTSATVPYDPTITGVTIKHLSCQGSLDGRIQVSASCLDPEIRYQLDNGTLQSFGIFSNLSPGTYTLNVWNGFNQIFYTQIIEILDGDPITIEEFKVLNSTCFGINNGSIEILKPKRPNLLYSINGGNSFSSQTSFSSLPSGNYQLCVLDPAGCLSEKVPVTITNNLEVTITNTQVIQQPSCAPNMDGRVKVSASGGFGNYSFGFNNAGYFSTDTLNNLPGDATVAIFAKDYLGCLSDTVQVPLTYLGKLELTIRDKIDASCSDETDGEIDITSPGGAAGMLVNFVDGLGFTNRFLRQDLRAQDYEVLIRDSNGCLSDTAKFSIVNTGKLRPPNVIVKPVNCNPPTDVLGGVAVFPDSIPGSNYDYSFDGGTLFKTGNDSLGLSLGTQLTIQLRRPQAGVIQECLSDLITVEVGEVIPLDTLSTSVVPESCYLFYDGNLVVNAIGGGGNYSYSLDGSPQQSSNIFSDLSSSLNPFKLLRIYTDDVCGLTDKRVFKEFTIDMGAIGPLTLVQYSREPITCEDYSDGEINIIITGGDPVFEFTIDGGANWGTLANNTGLAAGPYNLQVRDGKGCYTPIYSTKLLNPGPLVIADVVVTPVYCFGASSGSIEIVGHGGSEEYKYSIDGGINFQEGKTFLGLEAGEYSIVFEDLFGCGRLDQQVAVPQNEKLVLNGSVFEASNCVPGTDGRIVLFPSGGVFPYIFEDQVGSLNPSPQITGLVPGAYRYILRDKWGCESAPLELELNLPLGPILDSVVITHPSCFGLLDGKIQGFSTDNLSYSLDSGLSWKPAGLFLDQGPDNYQLRAKDSKECVRVFNDLELLEPTEVQSFAEVVDSILCFEEEASVQIIGIFGFAPYRYSINNGLSYSDQDIQMLGAGTYSIRVEDSHGCESPVQILTIIQPALLQMQVTVVPAINGSDGKVIAQGSGGVEPYQYSLFPGFFQSEGDFENLEQGNYLLELVDANNCSVIINVEVDKVNSLGALDAGNGLVIFPNPSSGKVFLKSNLGIQEVKVSNLLGETVYVGQEKVVDLKGMAAGVYIFEVLMSNKKVEQRRVILE